MDLIQKTKLLAQLIIQKNYLAAFFLACEILAAFKGVTDPALPVLMRARSPSLPNTLDGLAAHLFRQADIVEDVAEEAPQTETLQHLLPAYRAALTELEKAA